MTERNHAIRIDALGSAAQEFKPLGDDFRGADDKGNEIAFTDFYMTLNGRPTYMVMGEFLFSRVEPWQWEDELLKLKACGVNVVSFYTYWNYHEPEEGEWHFEGRTDIRRFVELIAKYGLFAVPRIGPYVHSETRNGGLPDWLYGKPFEVREANDGFLQATKRYYDKLGEQLAGLFYKDGGPIIACQVDNEYEHSTSPWEVTTAMSDEWINLGHGGDEYLEKLRELAEDAGFVVPFYTATAWGGAVTTDRAMPMWGGYPYRPWLFYQTNLNGAAPKEHPKTQEYLYQNFRSSEALKKSQYDLFDPKYKPETMPYVCCEMGTGMFAAYNYRFSQPQTAPDALANIKMASGCNFLGYYIFKSGTNPIIGNRFMNETQAPHIQYDFQGPMGEFGQTRESYFRYRTIHTFAHTFGERLCRMETFLPGNAFDISPEDTDTLRFAVRARGRSGFLFLNNFQDHAASPAKSGQNITVRFSEEPGDAVTFAGLGLASDENCVLPFGLDCSGVRVAWASVQPLTVLRVGGVDTYVFFKPRGMAEARYEFADGTMHVADLGDDADALCGERALRVAADGVGVDVFERRNDAGVTVRFITLTRFLADRSQVTGRGLVVADGALLEDRTGLRLESGRADNTVLTLAEGGFEAVRVEVTPFDAVVEAAPVCPDNVRTDKWTVAIDPAWLKAEGVRNVLLDIDYVGDMGQAFVDGRLVHDNFSNGETWQVGLHELAGELADHPLTLAITPLKKGVTIDVDSPMAARQEHVAEEVAELTSVRLEPIYEMRVW